MIKLEEGEFMSAKKENENSIKGKEIFVKKNDGEIIEGIVKDVDNETIIIAKNGNWDDEVILLESQVKVLDCSEFPYYSENYKRRLREIKKPLFEYRFNRTELLALLDNYVSVNIDGEIIEGKISSVNYSKKGNSITINCLDGEIKTVEDYQMRDLEITGSNYYEHKMVEKLVALEEELTFLLEHYDEGDPEGPDCKTKNPEDLVDEYFESKIKGVDYNLKNYNWCQEVIKQKECYKEKGRSFLSEFRKAKKVNLYYEARKRFVDDVVKKIEHIDWTKYAKTQEDGINKALNYIYESGVAIMLVEDRNSL